MRRITVLAVSLIFAFAQAGAMAAPAKKKSRSNPALQAVEAVATPKPDRPQLVIDVATGAVLHAQEARALWHPASLTKLMTAYVAFRAVKSGRMRFDMPLTVSATANQQKPSKMGFKPGSIVTLEAAMYMMMVKSANDMAVTIAEGMSGSVPSFVDEMNRQSQQLGLTDTIWRNPNGLPDPGQVTSARDLAILSRALILEFPDYQPFLNTGAIQVGNAVVKNHNPLLSRLEGADGLKTGYICASGFNMVATATRRGKRHIAVVLGADSARARTEWAALLLEKSFSQPSRLPTPGFFNASASQSAITLAALPRPANFAQGAVDMRNFVCSRRGKRNDMDQVTTEILAFAPQGQLSPENDNVLQMPRNRAEKETAKKRPHLSLLSPQPSTRPPLLMVLDPGDAKRRVPMRVALAGRTLPPLPPGVFVNQTPLPLVETPPAPARSSQLVPSTAGVKKNL